MEEFNLTQSFNGNYTSGGTSNPYWDINNYQPLVKEYYYNYYPYWTSEDKTSKAFKLVQILIEKKIIVEPKKVKDFIELVNSIVEFI